MHIYMIHLLSSMFHANTIRTYITGPCHFFVVLCEYNFLSFHVYLLGSIFCISNPNCKNEKGGPVPKDDPYFIDHVEHQWTMQIQTLIFCYYISFCFRHYFFLLIFWYCKFYWIVRYSKYNSLWIYRTIFLVLLLVCCSCII